MSDWSRFSGARPERRCAPYNPSEKASVVPFRTSLVDTLLQRLPNGSVSVFDREYRYLWAGGAGLAAVGLTTDYVLGRSLHDLFPPDEVALVVEHYARAFAGHEDVFELVTFGRHYSMTASPLSWADGAVATIVVVAQDITALVKPPEAVESLQAVVRQKDLLLATLGHEMRNPLGAMRLAVRLVRDSEERSVREHARVVLERQMDVLERLVADMLGGIAAQQGTLQLQLEPFDVTEVVAAAVESARHLTDQKRQVLEMELPEASVPVVADRMRVHQVVSNLLANAARYTPDHGTVSVCVREERDAATITVRDTGQGIASTDLAAIFQPFTRGGRPREDGGIGLGLWLAREIALRHGGTVDAHSEGLGQGATFTFHLPRRPPQGGAHLS